MSDLPNSAGNLFRAGKLADAIAAAGAALKRAPTDLGARILLAELLLFANEFERADMLLDAGADLVPDAAVVIAEFRQLLRAELARRQLYREGRVPEFLGSPSPSLSEALAALVAWRAGDWEGAARRAQAVEAARPRAPGRTKGDIFADFRDLDDLSVGFFEVLTSTGKYYWVPTERVESVEFHAPKRARDLFWRRASMSVRQGPDGDVYLPAIYASGGNGLSDALRLGRETDWLQDGDALTRGVGQRVFLVGDEPLAIVELTSLQFEPGASS